MIRQVSMLPRLILIACACIALSGCTPASESADKQPIRMANPAINKCLADGWEVKPHVVNGVPKEHICIDPKSGRQCEAWAYFRGECPAPQHETPKPGAGQRP
jgi:putative hemolysin